VHAPLTEAEAWFVAHGLPYFVDDIRESVGSRLTRARLVVVFLVAVLLAAATGVGTGLWSGHVSVGIASGVTALLVLLGVYAAQALKVWMIAKWALGRTFRSLGLLFPLATRALPMLLLFITFLFINTEVWQVTAALEPGVLWQAVMLFGAVAIGFLLVRLDEELDAFDDEIDSAHLVSTCRGTPFEAAARELAESGEDLTSDAEVKGLQKANLVLVLLTAQFVQVLLLSLAVFAFFIVFGVIAIDQDVILLWTAEEPNYPWGIELVSGQLVQVSVFLAAFSGLYFTVYAVTDEIYRKQFFTAITLELEQAVNARVAYRRLKRPTTP